MRNTALNYRNNTRTSRFVQNTVFTAAYQLTAMNGHPFYVAYF